MKKYITILSMFAAGFAFADDEVYDGQTLSGTDFSGKSMNYSSWVKSYITNSNFSNAKLREANFTNAKIASCKFTQANLTDAIFDSTTCYNDFSNATLIRASFKGTVLSYNGNDGAGQSNFTGANLKDADFSNAQLVDKRSSKVGAKFNNANLTNANFSNVDIIGEYGASADFTNADITGANFSNAVFARTHENFNSTTDLAASLNISKFSSVNFSNAVFVVYTESYNGKRGAAVDFSNKEFENVDFSNAILSAKYWYDSNAKSVSFANSTFKNCDFTGATLGVNGAANGVDFSNIDVSNTSFKNANLYGVLFEQSNISGSDFSNANGLTTSQLSQTLNYKNKDLSGVNFDGLDLTNWILRGQNLQNTSFAGANLTGVNARYADLRGSDLTGITGSLKTQNTIWADGEIKKFTMESVDDSLTIRAYAPATSGGAMINAKIADDASISGGAVLTLEQGAVLEIASGKTLSVFDNSEIIFNVDAAASDATKILLGENSKFVFGSDSKIIVNLDGVISPDDSYALSVIEVAADACISVADAISKDNLVLNVNGEAYDSDKWGFNFDPTTGALTINVNVPEPATVAAIFGALALAFAAYRRRK